MTSESSSEDILQLLLSPSWKSTAAKRRSLDSSGDAGLRRLHPRHASEAILDHPNLVKPPDDWSHLSDPRLDQEKNCSAEPSPNY